jgi:hypothetical protein
MKDIEKMLTLPWLEMSLRLALELHLELSWEIARTQKKLSMWRYGMSRALKEQLSPA